MDQIKARRLLSEFPERREQLEQRLTSYIRSRQARLFLLRTFWTLASLTGLLLIFLLIERTPIQSEFLRWIFATLAYLSAGAGIFFTLRAFLAPPNKVEAAVEIEEAAPHFRSGLSSAAEFSVALDQPGTSTALRKLTIVQAVEELCNDDINLALKRFSRRHSLSVFFVLLLFLAIWIGISPIEVKRGAMRLIFPFADLAPFSHLELVIYPGNTIIARGEQLQISAVPNQPLERNPVLILYNPGSHDGIPTEMYPDEAASRSRYVYTLTGLQESTDYQVTCEKFKSERFSVKVVPRPELKRLQLTLHHPAYIATQPEKLPEGKGDCAVLIGTRIDIEGEASQRLKSVELALEPGATQTCELVHGDGFKTSITIATDTRFSVILHNDFGLTNEKPVTYLISAIEDASPTVTILRPAANMPFPKSKRLDLKVVAKDDFGVAGTVLYYSVGDRRHLIPLNLKPDLTPVKDFEVDYPWMLDTIAVAPGTEISYFVKAEDARQPIANYATSPTYKVVMPSMLDIYSGADQAQGDVTSSLKNLLQEQRTRRESLIKTYEKLKHEGKLDPQTEQELEQAIKEGEMRDREAQEILEKFQEMQRNLEQNPFSSPEALEKLQKISQLVNEVLDDEGKRLMQQLRESLQTMKIDPKEMEKFEEAFKMDNYLKQLDRTVELLTQLRDEMKMNALGQAIEDLKRRQEAIASETAALLQKQQQAGNLTPEQQKRLDDLRRQQAALASEAAELQQKKQQSGQLTPEQQKRLDELQKQLQEIASETAALEKQQKSGLSDEELSKLKDLARQQEKIKEELAELQKQSKELAEKKPPAGEMDHPAKEDLKNLRDKFEKEDFRKRADDIKNDLEKQNLDNALQGQQQMLKFLEGLRKDGQKICQACSGGGPAPQLDLSRFIRRAIQVSRDQEFLLLQLQGMPEQFMRGQRPAIEGTIDEVSVLQMLVKEQARSLEEALETLVRTSFMVDPSVLDSLQGVQGILSDIVKNLEDRAIGQARRQQREVIRRFNLLAMDLMRAQDMPSQSSQAQSSQPRNFLQQFKELTRRQLSLYQKTLQQQMQNMSASDQKMLQQLRQMALEQRMIREALEQLMSESKKQNQLLGRLDDVLKDMKDLETQILDPSLQRKVAEKQKSIYDRMLRAQKSIRNRDDESEERKAEKASPLKQPKADKPLPPIGTDTRDLSHDYLSDLKEDFPKVYESQLNDYFKSLSLYGGNR